MSASAFSQNDFSCRSDAHPNPVVLLHGLGAHWYDYMLGFYAYLKYYGYCTFAIDYGAYPGLLPNGGLKPINESAVEIAAFIREVQSKTGASKVDLVGHSEGVFQALYVPKFEGVAPLVDKVVAISPPTRGIKPTGLYKLATGHCNLTGAIGDTNRDPFCSKAWNDLATNGTAVRRLNDGQPIAQPGNQVTVLVSRDDQIIVPSETAFVREPGVWNVYIQDFCEIDPARHAAPSYDLNAWNIVRNALDSQHDRPFPCVVGLPLRA
ncbi:hypothetical protein VTN00DRAFT_3545 [Thermoascus crustaceus]|uniref:uncharacterized protein n=1 Tax=Thermoascus crustaceus TaxID=5088 RepID=UPI003742C928